MNNFNLLENIETLIKAGDQIKARAALLAIKPTEVSPVDLVYFCSLLRRTRLSVEVIKILQPLVYPKARSATIATTEEKLEYASNLVRLGALSEAEKILNSIDAHKYPQVLIRLGFLVISSWDYEKANVYFKQYIDHPQAERYSVLVAKVNHLQGLVYLGQLDDAWALAQELLRELNPVQNRFLLGGVCEFSAEIFRQKKDVERALQFITRGKELFANSQSTDEFLLRKQEQIILGKVQGLKNIREEAIERSHYESVRDIDFHIALIEKNEKLLNEVYWKTKSKAYKQRILDHAQKSKMTIKPDLFQLSKNKGIVFDLQSHRLTGSLAALKKDQALARLLSALLVEGYSPVQIFDLFAAVYPDEIFFPESSADKIHQLLKRLRQFIQKARLPLEIICKNENYFVKANGHFSLSGQAPYQSDWEAQLHDMFQGRYFSVSDAQKLWKTSERTTLRRLCELKNNNRVQTHGKTRARKFRFCT